MFATINLALAYRKICNYHLTHNGINVKYHTTWFSQQYDILRISEPISNVDINIKI